MVEKNAKQTADLTLPCIINSKTKEVSAIWHDRPDLSVSASDTAVDKIDAAQGIWVPRFSVNAPWLFFSK
jgi:hypothetical protein